MFDRSAHSHVILALNKGTRAQERNMLDYNGFMVIEDLLGSWEGVQEQSYLIAIYSPAEYNIILDYAHAFNQQAIVHIVSATPNRPLKAFIIDTTTKKPITSGFWVNMGIHKPATDGWTQELSSGEYFVIQ